MLHYGLSPICGGIERSLDRLWTNIDKDIFQFDFIDEWNGRAYYREKFEAMGAKFFTIPSRRESVINNIKAWNSIPKDKYPDILHCHMNTLSKCYLEECTQCTWQWIEGFLYYYIVEALG